jgi:hypothetical protein
MYVKYEEMLYLMISKDEEGYCRSRLKMYQCCQPDKMAIRNN